MRLPGAKVCCLCRRGGGRKWDGKRSSERAIWPRYLGQRKRVFEAQIEEYRAAAEKAAKKEENERKFEKFHRENGPANATMSRDRRPTFPGGDRPNITRFDGAGKSKFNDDLNDEHDTDIAGRGGGGGGNSKGTGMLFPSFVGCFASCEIL
jgi:hypothetical protein